MVRISFSAVLAPAPGSQYDGGLSRQRAREADGVRREGSGLTAGESNRVTRKDGHFRPCTRIGKAPERAVRDRRPVAPMNGQRRMRLSAGSYLETWREVKWCWWLPQSGPDTLTHLFHGFSSKCLRGEKDSRILMQSVRKYTLFIFGKFHIHKFKCKNAVECGNYNLPNSPMIRNV